MRASLLVASLALLASLALVQLCSAELNMTVMWSTHIRGNLLPMQIGNVICSNVSDFSGCNGCMWTLADTISQVRSTRQNTILLDLGNYILGTPFNLFSPRTIFEVYRRLGYDVAALGYYDVNDVEGAETIGQILDSELRNSTYKTIVSNWNLEQVPQLDYVTRTAVINVSGVDVGVLCTIGFAKDPVAIAGNFSRVDFFEGVKRAVDELVRKNVAIIIAMLSDDFDFQMARRVAREIPGIDIILCSNDKSGERLQNSPGWGVVGPMPMVVTSSSGAPVYIGSSGKFANYLGVLDVIFDDNGAITSIAGDSYSTPPADRARTDPTAVSALSKEIYDFTLARWSAVEGRLLDPFGTCEFTQVYDEAILRYYETPVASFAADAYRFATEADIGIVNTGSIRNGLTAGPLHWANLFEMIPFYEPLRMIRIKGYNLTQMMNSALMVANETAENTGGVLGDPLVSGRFEGISGLRVKFNPDSHEMRCSTIHPDRVVTLEIYNRTTGKWLPVDLERNYTLAVNEFNRWGGDGFYMFPECPEVELPQIINSIDAVIQYVRNLTSVPLPSTGRIIRVDDPPKFFCEPLGPYVPVERQWTDAEALIFIILAAISLLAVIASVAFTAYFRMHPVMIASSTTFLFIILAGMALVLVSIFLEMGDVTDIKCNAKTWLLCVGFVLSYGAILAKNWRVYQLFKTQKLRRIRPIPNSKLLYLASFMLIIVVCILVIWAVVSPMVPSTLATSDSDPVARTYRVQCHSPQVWPYILVFLYFALMMAAGFALSILVRNAPVSFHESKWLALITYAIVLFGGVAILLFYLASSNEIVWFSLRSAIFIVLTDLCLCLLFVPKMLVVKKDPNQKHLAYGSSSVRSTAGNSLGQKSMADAGGNASSTNSDSEQVADQ